MPVLNMHFFCRLLVDNFERHLIKKAGGGRGIHIPSICRPLRALEMFNFPTINPSVDGIQKVTPIPSCT